uniref:Three finger toxins n=1 Tax=Phalotris mertensi TaxID=1260334 RepID=A0A182C5S7_9SAUR
MKTLLLSLVVVAFVYLDSGHTITCCSRLVCFSSEYCPDATACYKKMSGLNVIGKGCAINCTFPAAGEKIEFCTEDYCNK